MGDNYYIGVMSGTSFDGIDAVLVNFNQNQLNIVGQYTLSYPDEIKQSLLSLSHPEKSHPLSHVYTLDAKLGYLYAQAVNALLSQSNIISSEIKAIGCHGQTICHLPDAQPGFTVQIGDPNILATQTGITTIADFRRRDIAQGGQGAPLAPAFHHYLFHSVNENRAVVNIGGFANVTLLPATGDITGFDTGPGNCFIDYFAQLHLKQPFDKNGSWAASGQVDQSLLNELLSHPFFAKPAPKSTGRDEFHLSWLNNILKNYSHLPLENIQATLTELTAVSIAASITDLQSIYLCGGGAHNGYLVSRIAAHLPVCILQTTETLGIHPQWVESCLMAWLAQCTLDKKTVDLTRITGSRVPVMLGAVYYV